MEAAEPGPAPQRETAGIAPRIGAFILFFVLGFGAAVMIVVAVNPDDTPRCDQPAAATAGECFDISATQQTIATILAWPAGVLGALAALAALVYVFRGRDGRLIGRLAIPAVALGVLSVLVAQV